MIDKLKSILKTIFARVRTSERTDKDGKKILMVEEYASLKEIDHPDYRFGDFRDEIADVERRNNKG